MLAVCFIWDFCMPAIKLCSARRWMMTSVLTCAYNGIMILNTLMNVRIALSFYTCCLFDLGFLHYTIESCSTRQWRMTSLLFCALPVMPKWFCFSYTCEDSHSLTCIWYVIELWYLWQAGKWSSTDLMLHIYKEVLHLNLGTCSYRIMIMRGIEGQYRIMVMGHL